MKNQLLEPIGAAVKQQKLDRHEVQAAAEDLVKKVNEAKSLVKKSFQKYEDAFEKHADYQASCDRYNATGRIKDYDKMLTKVRAAKQKLDEANDKHEDAKSNLERLRLNVERTESPRLMAKMRETEAHRMKTAMSNLFELIELERRCASMDEKYATEMVNKLKQIDLQADDRHFTKTHIDTGISTGAMVNLSLPAAKTNAPLLLTPVSPKEQEPPRYTVETSPVMSEPPAYSMENLTLEEPDLQTSSYPELASVQPSYSRSLASLSQPLSLSAAKC